MARSNLTLLTDFYELTMMQAYFEAERKGRLQQHAVFDMFYRKNPTQSGYAIIAGVQQVVEYIEQLHFTDDDAHYLREMGMFSQAFVDYLKNFTFTGDIWAIPEGTVVFPGEPLIKVKAPIIQAQLVETALLNIINHQSLIATKASRVCYAAGNDVVLEFGLRRAQGPDAGLYGARAAIIGGCHGTSNVLAGRMFGVPVRGTHAHSWVMSHESEFDAFVKYSDLYPHDCTLLVDTYDTLRSGVPNAIRTFELMRDNGVEFQRYGIRLDSGDLAYLTKEARTMLDAAGFHTAMISASGDLDEYLIADLKAQGAKINAWGVGTHLITSGDYPSFGGVYKLTAETDPRGNWSPRLKVSDNLAKLTNPGEKRLFRFYDKETGKAKADLVMLADEKPIDEGKDITLFDPLATWKSMTLKSGEFYTRELLEPLFVGGRAVQPVRDVMQIRKYYLSEIATLWDEHKRLNKPQLFPVDLSKHLYNLKQGMLKIIKNY